jgi:hypothetical protein
MLQCIQGDILEYYEIEKDSHFCILTNGVVNQYGENVMGRGVASVIKNMFPWTPGVIARMIRSGGNHVYYLGHRLITFPTKNDWQEMSNIDLIKKSSQQLVHMIYMYQLKHVYLPKPGCGSGGLNWDQVEGVITPILQDQNITIIYKY